ncbi:asparagine synthase-related protein [Natronolimnohabitans innermongolicus]|uniref:Asparagine synthase n=1 Tax=Natronolimnohabitans innermongolicus JCM 12255 TaxID=1227499 RepID=L9WR20_9EURY|nr:asparagine synthase-related protein [Natronolimnohabitans innermongolicus]ELY51641.1 asparagine synthase [Natronolimnohabitans innermongolicus JCM 12255]
MSSTRGVIRTDGASAADALDEWTSPGVGVEYASDDVAISATPRVHRSSNSNSSRTRGSDDGAVRCWVIGDVYGATDATGDDGAYEPRPASVDPARYCLSRYESDDLDFVGDLNGNFALLLYDEERELVALCTDRLGTVPLYWARPDDDTIVFATNVQLLPFHPAVDTAFSPAYLHEYLAFRRTFGVKTPFEGIETFGPGTVTTIPLAGGESTTDRYWRPQYRPRDASFDRFVDEFVRRFRTVVDEWTRDENEYGVLLSGGSDSRLVLAGLEDATAFHMNDWMNREARIAERVAFETGVEFELLERGADYRIGALERNRWADSFNGWFTQPYTSGFEDAITARVDGLLSGLYADSLFGGYPIPSPTASLGPLGSVTLPVERSVETIDDYVDLLLERAHDDLEMPTDLRTVLESNIRRDGGRIVHHGVAYDSLDELVYYGDCYPLSNDDDLRFHGALRRTLPYRSPFLDNRLVDLSLSMPIRYRLRRNLVDRAVERLAPELAAIPHASTGVSLSRSFPASYAGEHATELWDKYLSPRSPPEPYLTDGPWLDDAELLRSFEFAPAVLESNADLVDALPGPDLEGACDLYRAHRRGENHVGGLYTLLTVLTMPATARVLDRESTRGRGRPAVPFGRCRKPEPEVIDVE